MKGILVLALPLALLAAACDLITGPDAAVEAFDEPPNIVLQNQGERTIYYMAIEQNTLALTLWGPCEDPDTCDRVGPGERREIPYTSITGYTPDAEVIIVYWWHLVPRAGGGFEPDSIRHEEVRL